jgi:alanine racemase
MRAWLEIDLDAVSSNYDIVQRHIGPETGIFAVVKSDAYGHGLAAMSKLLDSKGVAGFAVIELSEALEVRRHSERPVLILGYVSDPELPIAIEQGYILSLYDFALAPEYNRAAASLDKRLQVHIKVETGLNRLGMSIEEAETLLCTADEYPNLHFSAVYSHLAKSSSAESNVEQLARFDQLQKRVRSIPGTAMHLANSHALANFGDQFFDYVRVGLALYGVESVLPGLAPSLQCKTTVIQRKRIKAGEGVSYNHLFRAPEDMDIAVIGIGYAEGLTQGLTGKCNVIVGGKKTPIIGQICMNLCVIDARGIACGRGDEVVVVGTQGAESIHITELAQASGLRHHEIITRFGRALPRVYHGGPEE